MKAGGGSDGGGGDGGYDGRPMAVFFGRPGDSVRPDRFACPVEVSSFAVWRRECTTTTSSEHQWILLALTRTFFLFTCYEIFLRYCVAW